jgi:hypothetical protein
MAGFKQGGIEFKKKSVIGNPTTAEHIIVYWNGIDDLIIKTSTGEDVIATETLVASISAGLQAQIDNLDTGFVTESELTALSGNFQTQISNNTSLIYSVSGNLQTQINNLDFTYATDAILQQISGAIQDQIDNLDDGFATDAELIAVSGNLQGQITSNDTDISNLRTDVNTISGDLDALETQTSGITGGITQIEETISKSWSSLVNIWTTEPTFNINISGSGDVYDYVYDTTTYYRLVPEPYDSTQDTFYSNFNGTDTLTGVVATRGQGI